MVLMHDDRDVRVRFKRCLNEMAQEGFPRIFSRTCGGLHDHGAIRFVGCLHDGLNLL